MPALHHFSARFRVRYAHPAGAAENRKVLAELLERIAHYCDAAGATLIGHIKAFAAQPGGGYLNGSVTSADAPTQVEASGLQPQDRLEVRLAVLVYGLERERLAQIVTLTWQELADEGLLLSVRQQPAPRITKSPKEQP